MFTATFSITVGEYTMITLPDGLPDNYAQCIDHAKLTDVEGLQEIEGDPSFLSISRGHDWPFLVVAQRYNPVFPPGAIIIPETHLLILGAGERLLAFKLNPLEKLWEDEADTGFWGWIRHGNYIVMSAELELAAWDLNGNKLWTTFVEPPWEYSVVQDTVYLDVMGNKSSFPLRTGPATADGVKLD